LEKIQGVESNSEGQGVRKDTDGSGEDVLSEAKKTEDVAPELVGFSVPDVLTEEEEKDVPPSHKFAGIKFSQACEDITSSQKTSGGELDNRKVDTSRCRVPSESEESDSMLVQDGDSTVDESSPNHLGNLPFPKHLPDLNSDSSSLSSEPGSSSNLMHKIFMAKMKDNSRLHPSSAAGSNLKFSQDDFEGSASDSSQSIGSPSETLGPSPFVSHIRGGNKDYPGGDKQHIHFPLSKSSTFDSPVKEDDWSSTRSLGLARHEPVATHCPLDDVDAVDFSNTLKTDFEKSGRLARDEESMDVTLCAIDPSQHTRENSVLLSNERIPDKPEGVPGLKEDDHDKLRITEGEIETRNLQKELSGDDRDEADSPVLTVADMARENQDEDTLTEADGGDNNEDLLPPRTSSDEMEIGTVDISGNELPDAKNVQVPEESVENVEKESLECNEGSLDFRTCDNTTESPEVATDKTSMEEVFGDTEMMGQKSVDISQPAIRKLEETVSNKKSSEHESVDEANLLNPSSFEVDCDATEVDDKRLQSSEETKTVMAVEEDEGFERVEAEDTSGNGGGSEKRDSEQEQEQMEVEVPGHASSEVMRGEEETGNTNKQLLLDAGTSPVKVDCSSTSDAPNGEAPMDQSVARNVAKIEESELSAGSIPDLAGESFSERTQAAKDLVIPDLEGGALPEDSMKAQPTTDLMCRYEGVDSEEGTTGSSTGADEEWEGEGAGERKGVVSPEMSEECIVLQRQVEDTARQLLVKWSNLKEVFRIPKKASKPVLEKKGIQTSNIEAR